MKLTKRTIGALPLADREFTIWDQELRGFGCRVHPSGRRTFILKYRVGGGRHAAQRKLLLGTYGAITVDQARSLARHAQAEIVKGGDPAGRRAEHRRAETVKDFADRYIADHAKTKKSASSAREDRRLLDRHILPRIGTRKMVELTTADVSKIVHRMSATPVLANRVRALLSTMLSLAMVWGIRKDPINPARLVQKFPEKSRERFLSSEEVNRLGGILSDLEHTSAEPWQAIAAIRLLLLTGARKSEILSLRWDFIDYDNSVLLLPMSKTGRKTIYLTATVLTILASLPRKKGCPWVLPSRLADPNRHFDGVGHVWERVREKAGLPDVRLHDLRHTFASKGVGLGVGIPIIGGLLGHKVPTTTAKYAHLAADPLRAANDRIADRLEVELSGGQHADGYKRRVMVSDSAPANDNVGTDGRSASGPS